MIAIENIHNGMKKIMEQPKIYASQSASGITPPWLRCPTEMTSDQTLPDESNL